jgi:hypothetical protein
MPFEFRFYSWGISKSFLFLIGFFPVLFALAFRPVLPELAFLGVLFSLSWVFLISRGFYILTRIYFWLILSGLTLQLVFALQDRSFLQMFTAMICVLIFLFSFQWLERQLSRAQYSPGVKWYEGLPKIFPKVQIEVFWKEKWHQASLRKIDDYGMFLFLQRSEEDAEAFELSRQIRKMKLGLKIRYRDHQFEGEAGVKSVFIDRWLGFGLQICPKDLYHFTQYGKIVQNLKGEGYAT